MSARPRTGLLLSTLGPALLSLILLPGCYYAGGKGDAILVPFILMGLFLDATAEPPPCCEEHGRYLAPTYRWPDSTYYDETGGPLFLSPLSADPAAAPVKPAVPAVPAPTPPAASP